MKSFSARLLLLSLLACPSIGRTLELSPYTNYYGQNFSAQTNPPITGSGYHGNFGDAHFEGSVFSDSFNFEGAHIEYTQFTGASLTGANLSSTTGYSPNFTDANLTGALLTNASLNGGKFTGANLTGANATGGNFSSGNFTNANLASSNFTNVVGSYQNFSGADLTGANFSGVQMDLANFAGANFSGANFSGAALYPHYDAPLITAEQIRSAANVTGVNFGRVDFSSYDLHDVDLTGAYVGWLTLTGANLAGATLSNSTPYGISADQLRGAANVTGVSLRGNDLSGFDLNHLNLSGANFTDATLTGVDFTGTDLSGAILRNATVATAITPGQLRSAASVRGVILSGNNLSLLDLRHIDFTGANFTGSNLTQANFTGSDFTGANFTDADLTRADFTNATFTNMHIVTATLRTAEFAGANLEGATLGDATRHGFAYDNTLTISGTTTLASAGFASLGSLTELTGGTLVVANGVSLGAGRNLAGHGTVQGRIAAGLGSMIAASGGDLTIGSAGSTVGFVSDGELYTGVTTVILKDANQAVLGSLTQIGSDGNSGALVSENGLVVDLGRNLVGQGTVTSANTLAKAVVINGSVEGTGAGLTFTGYVKGTGVFNGPITFAGTYSPGLSPTQVHTSGFSLVSTSTLVMELGGLTAGSQYDQIVSEGLLSFDGTLSVEWINGFMANEGDTFRLFNYGVAPVGEFASIYLPALPDGHSWDTSALYSNGTLFVVPEPHIYGLGVAGGMTLAARRWRKRNRMV